MMKVGDPVLKDVKGDDFTKITFEPDLEKFNMTGLDKDTVALLNRRAFDIAACCKGVKVFLNGESISVSRWFQCFTIFVSRQEAAREDLQGLRGPLHQGRHG